MPVIKNEYNAVAKGGTELSIAELEHHVPTPLLDHFQIIPSRYRGLVEGLIPIFWAHDTAEDPENDHLKDGGWQKFEKIVFVSNWQMQRFIDRFNIPWSHCAVIHNAIEHIEWPNRDWSGTLNFIYHTTPHRGLSLLVPLFEELSKHHDVHLHVYSSFDRYGQDQRDVPFMPLYDRISNHPNMTYHGGQDLPVVRKALADSHVFLYPNIWQETGCRALIEAMCSGLVCIAPNYGALYETGMCNLASTYQYHEDFSEHATTAYRIANEMMVTVRERSKEAMNHFSKTLAHNSIQYYDWRRRKHEWIALLGGIAAKHGINPPGEPS